MDSEGILPQAQGITGPVGSVRRTAMHENRDGSAAHILVRDAAEKQSWETSTAVRLQG